MKKIFSAILVLFTYYAFAQDYQYSQFYNAPLHLNPAFAGTAEAHRVGFNARSQWTGVTNSLLLNTAASYDYNWADYNSGLGALVSNDFFGTTNLRNTTLDLMYAYGVPLDKRGNIAFRAALKAGVGSLSYDFGNHSFGDQYNNRGQIDGRTTAENLNGGSATYAQFGGGLLVYSERFWGGISVDRLFSTDIIGVNSTQFNLQRLPMQLSAHTGMRFEINDDIDIIPALNYKMQANYSQADIGLYFEIQDFTVGTWYRGLPIGAMNVGGVTNHDAIVVQVGTVWENIGLAYSFDATVSRLTLNTAGSHEVSLRYTFGEQTRRGSMLPCPDLSGRRRR